MGVMTDVVLVLTASVGIETRGAVTVVTGTAGGGESSGFSGITMSLLSSTGSDLASAFASRFSAAFSALVLRFDLRGGSSGDETDSGLSVSEVLSEAGGDGDPS